MSSAHPDVRPEPREHAHSHMRAYVLVFLALLALTGVTVLAAEQDFGVLNTVVALGIACLKAGLVTLYFMHVRWSERLVAIFAAVGLLFLVLLVGGTMHDYLTRDWMQIYGPVEPIR